jgi:nucleoside-diphosphate-sugar epimerase
MKILVVGAAGVIGRQLVPLLVKSDHEVVGTTRRAEKIRLLQELGAAPVIVDVFDREELSRVVSEVQPDVIIHQLTDLSARDFAANGRIRQVGTRNLVDAAQAAGVRHIIAQSIAWVYAPGEGPADESVPLDLEAALPRRSTVESVQALEQAVLEVERGIVLRYGLFYGPGTWYAPDGLFAEQVRRGELSADDGITSFVHVDDAARATLQALDWPAGVVNIVDDEPAPGSVWLPVYAATLGAPTPSVSRERPPFARGALNTKARQLLHWQPLYPSWREGFAQAAREAKS